MINNSPGKKAQDIKDDPTKLNFSFPNAAKYIARIKIAQYDIGAQ